MVVGDRVGIWPRERHCAKANANILEVTHRCQEFFAIMVIDFNMNRSLSDLRRELEENSMGMKFT